MTTSPSPPPPLPPPAPTPLPPPAPHRPLSYLILAFWVWRWRYEWDVLLKCMDINESYRISLLPGEGNENTSAERTVSNCTTWTHFGGLSGTCCTFRPVHKCSINVMRHRYFINETNLSLSLSLSLSLLTHTHTHARTERPMADTRNIYLSITSLKNSWREEQYAGACNDYKSINWILFAACTPHIFSPSTVHLWFYNWWAAWLVLEQKSKVHVQNAQHVSLNTWHMLSKCRCYTTGVGVSMQRKHTGRQGMV